MLIILLLLFQLDLFYFLFYFIIKNDIYQSRNSNGSNCSVIIDKNYFKNAKLHITINNNFIRVNPIFI